MITCLSLRQRLLSSSVVPSSIRADEIVDDLIGKSKRKQPLRGKNRINQMPSEWEHRLSLSESSAPGGNRDIVISLVYIFPFLSSQFSFH